MSAAKPIPPLDTFSEHSEGQIQALTEYIKGKHAAADMMDAIDDLLLTDDRQSAAEVLRERICALVGADEWSDLYPRVTGFCQLVAFRMSTLSFDVAAYEGPRTINTAKGSRT